MRGSSHGRSGRMCMGRRPTVAGSNTTTSACQHFAQHAAFAQAHELAGHLRQLVHRFRV